MSFPDEEWWDLQAAEYVLGSSSAERRQIIARLLMSDKYMQEKVALWEHRLDSLNDQTEEVVPAADIFSKILKRIHELPDSSTPVGTKLAMPRRDFRDRKWKALSVVSIAVAACMATVAFFAVQDNDFLRQSPDDTVSSAATVAVLEDASGLPVWSINIANSGLINNAPENGGLGNDVVVTVVGSIPLADDKSHQLWLVPSDGSDVRSVGLIPNEVGRTVRMALPAELTPGVSFAVSLEDEGGVPGPEHGPVLTISEIVYPLQTN